MTVAVLAPTVWLCPGGIVPRRRVTMHIEDLTDRVKEWSKLTRLEFNRKLEDWYNDEPQTNADVPSLTLGRDKGGASVSAAQSAKVCG